MSLYSMMMTSLQRLGYYTPTISTTNSDTNVTVAIDTVDFSSSTNYSDIGYFANMCFPNVSVYHIYIILTIVNKNILNKRIFIRNLRFSLVLL